MDIKKITNFETTTLTYIQSSIKFKISKYKNITIYYTDHVYFLLQI